MMRLKSIAAVFALTIMGFGIQACNKEPETGSAFEETTDDVPDTIGDGPHETSDSNDSAQDSIDDITE